MSALGELIAIVDPKSEPRVIPGKRAKESVLSLRLYRAEGTVGLKGRGLTWSRSFAAFSEVPGLPAGTREPLFPRGYVFNVGDASVEVVATMTRDLIGIEQSNAQRRDRAEFLDLSDRVDSNIRRLAELGSLPDAGLSEKQREVATKRAMELMVMSSSARARY